MVMMRAAIGVAAIALMLAVPGSAEVPRADEHWVGSWATSQQIPEENNRLPDADLTDATLRQKLRMSTGGDRVRVELSNAFGTQPLTIDAAHVALAAAASDAAILPASDTPLLFDGSSTVTIPAGASYLSDPVALAVPPLATVAVTIHLPNAPARQTGHPGSRQTSWLVHGDRVGARDLPGANRIDHWYQLAAIEVAAPRAGRAIVALGDSITDGHAATTNGNDRWPDRLAERLRADPTTRNVAVLNQGIGGNRLLDDGLGPNALARLDRDALAQPGARYVIVLEGVNDLGTLTRDAPVDDAAHAALVARIIGAYRQIVARAHARGLTVVGGTITPYIGSDYYHPDRRNEADRQAINRWIRTSGVFDAVVDFDAAMRDPANPTRLRPDYDSGDHLHPSPAGYRAMADAIPLALFR